MIAHLLCASTSGTDLSIFHGFVLCAAHPASALNFEHVLKLWVYHEHLVLRNGKRKSDNTLQRVKCTSEALEKWGPVGLRGCSISLSLTSLSLADCVVISPVIRWVSVCSTEPSEGLPQTAFAKRRFFN